MGVITVDMLRILRLLAVMMLIAVGSFCRAAFAEGFVSRSGIASEQAMSSFRSRLQNLPVDSLFHLGTSYFNRKDVPLDTIMMCYITAQHRLDQEQKRGNRKNIEAIVKTYINTAYIYSNFYRDYSEAYIALHKAEKICLDNRLDSVLAIVKHSQATLRIKSENIRQGHTFNKSPWNGYSYFKEVFEAAARTKMYDVMSYSLFNYVSDTDILDSNQAEVAKFAGRYLSFHIPDTVPTKRFAVNMCRGLISHTKGEYDKAISYYRQMTPAGYPMPIDSIKMAELRDDLIAQAYEGTGNNEKSREILNSLLDSALERDDPESQLILYLRLYRLCLAMNQPEEANSYLYKYLIVREKIASMGSDDTSITEIELKQSVRDYDNSLKVSMAKERQSRLLAISISIIAICVIAVLILSLYHTRKRHNYIMALYEKNIARREEDAGAKYPARNGQEDGSVPGEASEERQQSRDVTAKSDDILIEKIVAILSNDDCVFDPDYQMARLCAQVGSNASYVSRAINAHYGKNFKTVLTERRIREACRRFDNPRDNASLTIEAISLEVGFKSRTAFASAFRNVTGLTPSEYRKAARKYMPTA